VGAPAHFLPAAFRFGTRFSAVLLIGSALFFAGPLVPSMRAQENADPRLPDQAHVMMDVGYHFANLWVAADNKNWPLAAYYVGEVQSHLAWAVRIRPIYTTKSGGQVELSGILEAVTNTFLKAVGEAVEKQDMTAFRTAYEQTMAGCYACHSSCEKPFLRLQIPTAPGASIISFAPPAEVSAANDPAGRGQVFFQQNCALCHATGVRGMPAGGQGPSLAGVVGRKAASAPNFNYTKALSDSGITWDAASLDRFLANPIADVHGTTMLVMVPDAAKRREVIAFLSTLKAPAASEQNAENANVRSPEDDPGSWLHASPGLAHRIDLAALPDPFATSSAGNGPRVVPRPDGAQLSVPPNFTVREFADGLSGPRLLRVAPNGDLFIAETGESRIRVMRAADGADAPSVNQIYADDLNRPFGIAFYPAGDDPQWIYIANNNSIVRIPYHSGDLKARDTAQVVVRKLTGTTGGHTTRDVMFSKDGKRMFISAGSGSNVAEEMEKKSAEAIRDWEAEHGLGACWGAESNRANILVTDPEGHDPLRVYASGVRNGVSMAVNAITGDLWVSTNERDGLGDDLVPDYLTRIKEGAYYGWPWYYMGNHEDPRHAGERPDLAGKATVPDVPVQAHSASLEMTFYTATSGSAVFPEEYRGDIFAAFHGSWNRHNRTGSKVVRVRVHEGIPTGEYDDFLTGFVIDTHSVWGRPVGVAVAHDGALLVSEDGNSTIWRVAYNGAK